MSSESYVFLSYSQQDSSFVDRLATDLRAAGVPVWRASDEIAPGQNWEGAIQDALERVAVLLYISSAHSAQSAWTHDEVAFAQSKGTPTVPVIIDDSRLPLSLSRYQWIDFRTDYQQALAQLLSALPDQVRHEHPIEATTPKSRGYVFISYAEEDSSFVVRLKSFMAERKYAYWDYQESNRNYQRQLALELEDVIAAAVATLSVLSPDWKGSEWTAREFFFSEEIGVPVFLLRAKDPGPTLAIAGRPYIDFVRDSDEGFLKLDQELKRKGL